MLCSEERHIKIQIYHELIGNHSFQFTDKNHMSELRLHVTQNSPLYIYENFHFEMGGSRLQEYNQLSEIFKSDARLTVVFDPYDHYTSRFHQIRVRQILNNPLQWSIVNSHEIGFNLLEDDNQTYPTIELDQMFDNPFNSPLLKPSCNQSQFSGILNVSGFNPPPYYRKLEGDLYYLQVHTLQDTDFHITASAEGFFVNHSTHNCFNPAQNTKYFICISLIDLIAQLSPKFKTRFQQILRNAKITEFEKILHNSKPLLQNWNWLKNTNGWKKTNVWRNDGHFEIQKQDFSVVKDWVQIFQFQRASSTDSLYQKLGKQKIKYKLYQQFVECAKEGVQKIFKGNLQPVNNDARFEHQVYYHSYLLFYFATQQPHPHSATHANRQLINISAVEPLDTEGVCLSHMIIVNYRGFNIIVRTIPSSLVNGHSPFANIKQLFQRNNHLQQDQILTTILKKICKQLAVESQNVVLNHKMQQSFIIGHPQITGCVTKDKKRFIFGLNYLSPRDVNFQDAKLGCLLRPQLMKIYNTKHKCGLLYNPLVSKEYTLVNNTEKARLQQKKLQSIAKFAKQIMIPMFIDSFDGDMKKYLCDSRGVLMNLHKHGLSSKYLGQIYTKAIQKQSNHVQIVIDRIILVKSLKNLFRKAMRVTPVYMHNTLLKHLLNCLFFQGIICEGTLLNNKNQEDQDSNNPKKGKKKRIRQNEAFFEISIARSTEKYLTIPQAQFWEQLKAISLSKYKHAIAERTSYFQLEFSRTAILRDLCLCLGLQLERRDYFADHSAGFNDQHILNLVPRVKLIMSEPRQLSDLIQEGDRFVCKYQIQQAFQAYNRALQYIFTAFGGVHQKLGLINKKIASIYFKIGDPDTAVIFALNSCQVYQKLFGQEHVETIQAYLMTGIYHFARKKFSSAQHFILKAIFLSKFAYSQSYPELMGMYLNLSTVYEIQRKYTDAIMSIFNALHISIHVYGQNHFHTAIIYSALAALHYDIPDIAQSIKYQQKSVQILQKLMGSQDERLISAKNTCEAYKSLQDSKRIRQVHEKDQKNFMGIQSNRNMNIKVPFYDFKQKSAQFFWKKGRRNKYFL